MRERRKREIYISRRKVEIGESYEREKKKEKDIQAGEG